MLAWIEVNKLTKHMKTQEKIIIPILEWDNDKKGKEQVNEEKSISEEYLAPYVGEKVEIEYSQSVDFFTSNNTKKGRIYENPKKKGQYYFIPLRCRVKGYSITHGIFSGFQGTIVIKSIKTYD